MASALVRGDFPLDPVGIMEVEATPGRIVIVIDGLEPSRTHPRFDRVDVFVGEPAPPTSDNPLFSFDNVIVSPHSAGVTQESLKRTAIEMIQNVLDAFDDEIDPATVVNPEVLRGHA